MQHLVFRLDSSTQIGTGHLMRSLALAQAWQDANGHSIFIMAMSAPLLEQRLQSEGIKVIHLLVPPGSVEDARETAALVRRLDANLVVVDGYHFSAEYQGIIKGSGLRLLFIDDYGHANHYYADIVLNQNIYAHNGLYTNRESYTQMFLGTRYALLRREFLHWRGWKRDIPTVAHKVLVTLGGSDPDNVTIKVIQALQLAEVNGLEAVVVVGGSNPYYEQLQSAVQESRLPIRLVRNVTNMPELMAWANMAIASSGSTTWELAFMGLPSIILVLADNQRTNALKLGDMGVAINLGWHKDVSVSDIGEVIAQSLISSETYSKMSRLGQNLVDGEGTARVLMHLKGEVLRLRSVREDDCKLLWHWANDLEVRGSSFSSDPIPYEKHLLWFTNKLHDSNCYIFIALDNQEKPIGQVRFETQDNDKQANISISLDKGKRGMGYGIPLIDTAVKELFRLTSIQAVHAFIKPHNKRSIRVFEQANFKILGQETVKGSSVAMHYVRVKTTGTFK